MAIEIARRLAIVGVWRPSFRRKQSGKHRPDFRRVASYAVKLQRRISSVVREIAPTVISLTLALILVSPVPSAWKLVLTLVAALFGLCEVGGIVAQRLKFEESGWQQFRWSFALVVVALGGFTFAINRIDAGVTQQTIIVVTLLSYAVIISPIIFGRQAYARIEFEEFLHSLTWTSEARFDEELNRFRKGGRLAKATWFAVISGFISVLTMSVAAVFSVSLMFPPVAAALGLLYAFWLLIRLKKADGLISAMTWFRAVDTSVLVPMLTLATQFRIIFFLIVLVTMLETLWPPGLLLLIMANANPSWLQDWAILGIAVPLILTTIAWYIAELYLVGLMCQRLSWFSKSGQALRARPISWGIVAVVVAGNASLGASLLAFQFLSMNLDLALVVGLTLIPVWIAILVAVLKRPKHRIFCFDEHRERRRWICLYLVLVFPVIVISPAIGFSAGIGVALSLPLLGAVVREVQLLLESKYPKAGSLRNVAAHQVATFLGEVLFLSLVFWFFHQVEMAALGMIVLTVGGVALLLAGSSSVVLDLRMIRKLKS